MIGKKKTFYLEQIHTTKDAVGGMTAVRETIRKFYGYITSVYGKEDIRYDRELMTATHIIYCDYFSQIDESYQIRDVNTIYDIKYIYNVDDANKMLKIYAEERK